jgi:hypothetical protein
MATQTMKAVNYAGPHRVRVEDISVPTIEHPDDIIVKVTTVSDAVYHPLGAMRSLSVLTVVIRLPFAARICSEKSRLPTSFHLGALITETRVASMYEGRTAAEAGITFGRYIFFHNDSAQGMDVLTMRKGTRIWELLNRLERV